MKDAVEENDHKKIVKCIEDGLDKSTHLLCLISDKTIVSWWVPYEIGYGKHKKVKIASLKLKKIEDMPSFLEIEDTLWDIEDLNIYLRKIGSVSKSQKMIEYYVTHPLENYVDWKFEK